MCVEAPRGRMLSQAARERSPVRPEGLAGRLEPDNDKPPTYWLSAHGRSSLSRRSTQAAAVASAPRLNPYWTHYPHWWMALWANRVGLWEPGLNRWGWSCSRPGSSHLASSALRCTLMKAEGNIGWRCLYVIMSHFQRGMSRRGSRSPLTSPADVWKWC